MNKLSYYLLYAVWYLLSLLPLWVHYLFSDFIKEILCFICVPAAYISSDLQILRLFCSSRIKVQYAYLGICILQRIQHGI